MTAAKLAGAAAAMALAVQGAVPAVAKDSSPALVKCDASLGTIALVDGDLAGWSEYGLGSPRELINSLAIQSGCFTPHTSNEAPARFLVTAVAGNQEEVDRTVQTGKAVATEALVRSGAAGRMLGGMGGLGGAALGMFGGLGGKKKTIAAGLRVVSPMNGQSLASGTGSVKKSTITFGNAGGFGWASSAASAAGYQDSKDGRMLAEAFIIAFNQVVAQKAALEAAPAGAPAQAAAAVAAVDTVMREGPSAAATELRSVRAGSELSPTGKREGLFLEVADNYGTKGWVSVEDLK